MRWGSRTREFVGTDRSDLHAQGFELLVFCRMSSASARSMLVHYLDGRRDASDLCLLGIDAKCSHPAHTYWEVRFENKGSVAPEQYLHTMSVYRSDSRGLLISCPRVGDFVRRPSLAIGSGCAVRGDERAADSVRMQGALNRLSRETTSDKNLFEKETQEEIRIAQHWEDSSCS